MNSKSSDDIGKIRSASRAKRDIEASQSDPNAPTLDSSQVGASRSQDSSRGPLFSPGDVAGGRYQIESFLAEGGMGQVFRALDLDLQVLLALKTVHPRIASDPSALRRFKQEVLLARSISHPNVCRIFDLGRDESTGVAFLTMELLSGETLASRIRRQGRLSSEQSLPIFRQMADALDAAHRVGIVHRDFKSPNVMLVPSEEGERAVITDFGLAISVRGGARSVPPKQSVETPRATPSSNLEDATIEMPISLRPSGMHPQEDSSSDRVVGTPAYMAPEQVVGGTPEPASDLYSLGVVLFEMATGQLPFSARTPSEVARAQIEQTPPVPSSLVEIDAAWESVIVRLLSKDPKDRFRTASDAFLALEHKVDPAHPARLNVPEERDVFVGRTEDLEAIARHFESSSADAPARCLTLQGTGGMGKSRLARRYGLQSRSQWPGGVWFCDLSETRSAEGIVIEVANSLGIPLGKGDPASLVGQAIAARKKCLVILDNFEQIVSEAASTLGRWIEQAPDAAFLVTSQVTLKLSGETVFELEPLDPRSSGVELFEVRGQSHLPQFRVDAGNRELVEQIVEDLDGLPLAIELAASRLRVMSLVQLRDRLEDRFKLLGGGKRGRHSTLRKMLDWSWELLAPWEQSAVAQASVFDGGFTLEAGEEIIDLSAYEDAPFVLDVIQSLVDKSWLHTRVPLKSPRFHMYANVHDYASKKLQSLLAESGASDSRQSEREAEARHGAFFSGIDVGESIDLKTDSTGAPMRLALRLELDNLVTACRRALARNDASVAGRVFLLVCDALILNNASHASIELGQQVLDMPELPPGLRGRVLTQLCEAEGFLGNFDAAIRFGEAAVSTEETNENPKGVVQALDALAVSHMDHGRIAEADTLSSRSLAIARTLDDSALVADVLVAHGNIRSQLGEYEAAEAVFREIAQMYEGMGEPYRRSLSTCYLNLGNNRLQLCDLTDAETYYRRALEIDEQLRGEDHPQVATLFHNLAIISTERGRLDEALDLEQRSITIRENVFGTEHWHVALCLGTMGYIAFLRGDAEKAEELVRRALAIDEAQFEGDKYETSYDLDLLGRILLEEKRLDEAESYFLRAVEMNRSLGFPPSCNLAWLYLERGDLDRSQAMFQAALEGSNGWASEVFDSHAGIAQIAHARGDTVAVAAAVERALDTVKDVWGEDHPLRIKLLKLVENAG